MGQSRNETDQAAIFDMLAMRKGSEALRDQASAIVKGTDMRIYLPQMFLDGGGNQSSKTRETVTRLLFPKWFILAK